MVCCVLSDLQGPLTSLVMGQAERYDVIIDLSGTVLQVLVRYDVAGTMCVGLIGIIRHSHGSESRVMVQLCDVS
jgi:hypothetical protein